MTEPTLGAILKAHGTGPHADEVAISYGDVAMSWRELDQRSDARAAKLLAAGVRPDDFVALTLPNCIAHHEWSFATWKAGATPCVLPTRLPAGELANLVALAKPRVLVRLDQEPLEGVAVLAADAAIEPVLTPPLPDLAAGNWKAIASGGSTGQPKLIVDHGPARLTPKVRGLIELVGMPAGGVMLSPGPLHHNAGFLFSSLGHFARTTVVGMERFDAEQCLALIERHRVQWLFLVPTMMHRIWSLPGSVLGRYDLSSLQRVVHMAAACPVWLKAAWIDWLGAERILEGYAGTEGPGTMITGTEWLQKPGSVGRVQPDGITVRNADGEVCAPGEIGEIFFPPGATDRFHYIGAQPRLDAQGRMSLGDMGHLDAESYLFLADRRTDLIIRGGANIYPAEIEAALSEHPAVASTVVIGLPCDEFGHRVHALVEPLWDAHIDTDDLDTFVRQRLPSYKCPESYEVVTAPLRDESGKVRRGALRDERIRWLREKLPFQRTVERRSAGGDSLQCGHRVGEV
jgi:bile acid-coenzyme A ligase